MRIVGRYFAIGATLGSVSGLVALVLIWVWLTVHLGVFGLLLGWIPGAVVAVALWLTMVVFWGPILFVGAMTSLSLVLLRVHPGHGWSAPAPFVEHPSEDQIHAPRDTDAAPEAGPDIQPQSPAETSSLEPTPPAETPPAGQGPEAAPSPAPTPKAAPAARGPLEDLGDAAAAGDTSRKRPN